MMMMSHQENNYIMCCVLFEEGSEMYFLPFGRISIKKKVKSLAPDGTKSVHLDIHIHKMWFHDKNSF